MGLRKILMSKLRGHLDEVGGGIIRGWILDEAAPQRRLLLDLFIDGHFAGQILANQQRPDLRAAGVGDGYHGFEWRSPDLTGSTAASRVVLEVPRVGFWHRAPAPAAGTLSERVFASPSAYLQMLLARLPDTQPMSSPTAQHPAPLHARLLQPADLGSVVVCRGEAISAYQDYVLHRFRLESDYDTSFTMGEYERFLRWYIRHYGAVRANLRIPLSNRDIAFLNRRSEATHGKLAVMTLFADHFSGQDGFEEAEWALYNARALGISDCITNWSFASPGENIADRKMLIDLFACRHPILKGLDRGRPEIEAALGKLLNAIYSPQCCVEQEHARIETTRLTLGVEELVDVQMIGPFSKALGVGESCRRMAKALEGKGFSIRACDFTIDYPNEDVADLSIKLKPVGPAKVNIIHLNLEEIPKLVAFWPDVFSNAINIAVPYIELSGLAPEQKLGLSLVDRVFAATNHIKDVIGSGVHVDVIGSALENAPIINKKLTRSSLIGNACQPEDFVVLVTGDALSGLDRKNLIGAVRAFLAAFPQEPNRKLVIKTHSVLRTQNVRQLRIWNDICEIARNDNRIILMDKHLGREEYRALQAACDVYLSLHRAEGLGYHVLECMQLGVPCIVTDYSGTKDFAHDGTALLVGHRLVPAQVWEYPFTRGALLWADPSIIEAAGHLRCLASDPRLGRQISLKAKALVESDYSLDALGERLSRLLHPLL